ncbi:MAG TPA: metalloregulator ArsR/SmtB family transcription factor [Anaerolineales bacterium]
MLNYLPAPSAPPVDLAQMAQWLKALAEPNRLLIFHLLMEGVQCNCEFGDGLQMAPNLISHHLKVLREAGLVDVERDLQDARWMYYSINRQALEQLNAAFGAFFDPERIKPRRLTCGPKGELVRLDLMKED